MHSLNADIEALSLYRTSRSPSSRRIALNALASSLIIVTVRATMQMTVYCEVCQYPLTPGEKHRRDRRFYDTHRITNICSACDKVDKLMGIDRSADATPSTSGSENSSNAMSSKNMSSTNGEVHHESARSSVTTTTTSSGTDYSSPKKSPQEQSERPIPPENSRARRGQKRKKTVGPQPPNCSRSPDCPSPVIYEAKCHFCKRKLQFAEAKRQYRFLLELKEKKWMCMSCQCSRQCLECKENVNKNGMKLGGFRIRCFAFGGIAVGKATIAHCKKCKCENACCHDKKLGGKWRHCLEHLKAMFKIDRNLPTNTAVSEDDTDFVNYLLETAASDHG